MKNIKRICSLIICFIMLFCTVNICSAAEADNEQSLEEKYPSIVNKISLFYELGVFDFEYAVDDYVSRSDFAIILTRLLKAENMLTTPSTQIYTDVKTDDYASENISLMYDMGIMSGKSKTEFCPDDDLTLSEANSALVRLLGYDSKAYAKGGWSAGFNMTANDLGLNKSVPSELNFDYLPAGALAVMLFNAMEVKMVGSYSTKDGCYILSDSTQTLMYDYWNIVKDTGIVNCVGNIDIFGVVKNHLELDELEIDGEVFIIPYDEYKSYLGMSVDYYYYDDDTVYKHEIIMMNPRNNVKTARIYSDSEGKIDANTIVYYDKEKNKNVSYKISNNAMIVHNGESVRNLVFPKNGYIDLIANDSSSYNVVLIYDFQTFKVKGRVEEKLIFDYNAKVENTGLSSIELDNTDSFYTIIKDGAEIDYSKINVGDIVSVAYSNNAGYYVVVSSAKSDIFVDSIVSNPMKLISSNKEYSVNKEFLALIDNKAAGTSEIVPGKFYSFSFDFMGHIYGMEETKSEMLYGYLKGVRTDGAFADSVEVKLFSNLSNEFTVYPVNEKCILNGVSTTNSAVYTELNNVLSNSDFANPPVIKFRLDEEKKINRVTTTTVVENDYTKISDDVIVRSRTADPIAAINYTVWQTSLGFCTDHLNTAGNIFFDSNIPILKVPTSNNEEQFNIGTTKTILPNSDNTAIPLTFYDLSEFNYPGFVIYFSTSQGSNVKIRNSICGVESIFTAVNQQGEQVGGLEYWQNGDLKIGYTSSDDEVIDALNALQKGDLIQFNIDDLGNICAIEKMFSYHSDPQVDTSDYDTNGKLTQRITATGIEGNWSAIFRFKSGKLKDDKTVMRFYSSTPRVYRSSAKKFTFYDGEKFYGATVDSIEDGDTLVIVGNSASMSTFVVLKNLQNSYDLYTNFSAN